MNSACENSIFSFCIIKKSEDSGDFANLFEAKKDFGEFVLYSDCRTPVLYAEFEERCVALFGYAVNVFNGESENLADLILSSCKNIDDVIGYEKQLGGKYVIFYAENEKCFCVGDATCSVPVFYTTGTSRFVCAFSQKLISDHLSLKPDPKLLKIRKSGNLNQAMPYDVTIFKEIKQLVPNHCLDMVCERSVRFVNENKRQKKLSARQAAKITLPMIAKIADFYSSKFKLRCPLTAGRDSRVVLSFLKSTPTYTVWQPRFEKDNQDWVIPPRLANLCGVEHSELTSVDLTDKDRVRAEWLFGENNYSVDVYRLALTLEKYYPNEAVIEGDIIGQVGKCSLHRDIPSFLASSAYFRCKLHNYSKESKILLKEWLKEIKNANEKVNVFDLFSVENRLGRWSAQTHIVHNMTGRFYFNIFNSRSIIYAFSAVDRKKRKNSEIHIEFIKNNFPILLSVPFEKDKSTFVKIAKLNGLTYYFASFAKFFIERRKFEIENKNKP